MFSDLVPKLRREDEAKCEVALFGMKCPGGENERKFLEIQCGRVKYYLWERGIQLSDGGKGKKKAELFDLYKKAAAASAEDHKSCWRRSYKQVRTNF